MAVNKIIYGGETLIDLTEDTVTESYLLNGYTAHNRSGIIITGSMPNRTGTDTDTIDTVSEVITISQGYHDGNGTVQIAPAEQAKLIPSNIIAGVTVLGETGVFTAANTVSAGQTAASASQILSGYSAWVDGAEVKGNIANNGSVSGTITTVGGTVTVPAGYTTGGTVSVDSTNISAGNIKAGVVILGVTGTYNGESLTAVAITTVPFINEKTYSADDIVPSGKTYYSDTSLTTSVGTLSNATVILAKDTANGYATIMLGGTVYYVDLDDVSGIDYISQVTVPAIAYTETSNTYGTTVTIGTVDPTYVAT